MTVKPVLLHAVAKSDVQDALDHYLAEAGNQVALSFIDDLQRAYRQIARYPERGSPRYAQELDLPDLRPWPIKHFPYLVFYVETEHHIDLRRELHAERDIPKWMNENS